MLTKELKKQLKEVISKEIELIKYEVFFIIDQDFDIYFLKEFAKHRPQKLLKEKAKTLLDTLLNYLMKETLEKIKNLHPDYQYEFFKENLRNKIKVLLGNRSFKPRPLKIKEKENLLDKINDVIPGLVVSITGIVVALVISETLLLKTVPATSSLVGFVYIVKKLENENKRLKKLWKKQIDSYLKLAKKDLEKWLSDVEKDFLEEWQTFCAKIVHSFFVSTKSVKLQSGQNLL